MNEGFMEAVAKVLREAETDYPCCTFVEAVVRELRGQMAIDAGGGTQQWNVWADRHGPEGLGLWRATGAAGAVVAGDLGHRFDPRDDDDVEPGRVYVVQGWRDAVVVEPHVTRAVPHDVSTNWATAPEANLVVQSKGRRGAPDGHAFFVLRAERCLYKLDSTAYRGARLTSLERDEHAAWASIRREYNLLFIAVLLQVRGRSSGRASGE